MKNKLFLATTAFEKFWNKDADEIIFLGEWCKLYDNKEMYEKLNYTTLEYIWKTEKEIDAGIKYCDDVYEKVLSTLINKLNSSHNISKDYKYWNALLKPWLYIYIQVIYDRYRHITLAYEKYPKLTTWIMDESSYQYVSLPNDFAKLISNDDFYNLQLYSQVVSFVNLDSTVIQLKKDSKLAFKIELKSNFKERFLRKTSTILNKLFNTHSIVIIDPYFKRDTIKKIFQLLLKSRFLFIFDNLKYDIKVNENINLKDREEMFSIVTNDEFESLIYYSLVYNFPLLYLEGYKQFSKKLKFFTKDLPKTIFSVTSIHHNEVYKFFVAENVNKLNILYGQHGGNIGIDKVNIPETMERSLSNIYYTYGWQDKNTRVLPLAQNNRQNQVSDKINLIMTAMPRYFYRFVYQEESTKVLNYIENTKSFLKNLKIVEKITVRLYMNDYEWSIKKRLLEVRKDLYFDNNTNYYKQISNAKLNIFDHMHTGYLETLNMNIPTIIIIPKNIYYFRDSVKLYIQKLKDVKILFDDPVEASIFVDKIYNSIDNWWFSDEVQKVREEFCFQYARVSNNWADDWIEEFHKVLKR